MALVWGEESWGGVGEGSSEGEHTPENGIDHLNPW